MPRPEPRRGAQPPAPAPAPQPEPPSLTTRLSWGAPPPPKKDHAPETPGAPGQLGVVSPAGPGLAIPGHVPAPDPQEAPLLHVPGAVADGLDASGGRAGALRKAANANVVRFGAGAAGQGGRAASPRGGRRARPNSSSRGGADFRDKLEALLATHDLEVSDLRDEVVGLQDLVAQYQSLIDNMQDDYKRVRGKLLCAASDGPAMSDLVQEIAGEMGNVCFSMEESTAGSIRRESIDPAPEEPSTSKSNGNGVLSKPNQGSAKPRLAKRMSLQAKVMPPAARRALADKLNRRKKIKGDSGSLNHRTFLQRLVDTTVFDLFCAFMIINNSIIIGFEVQWLTSHEAEPSQTKVLGLLCSLFFFVELVIRIMADGTRFFFFTSENRNWNWFDFALVSMSTFDLVSLIRENGGEASTIGMGIKTIKMLRIVRVVRVFRFFNKLSQLAFMIIDSVKSLMWALIMLGIVIYVFAIFFTHYAADHVKQGAVNSILIEEHFGSLWTTLYTLFHCMLNGMSWYTIPSALYTIPGWTGPFLSFGFVGYLSFTMLAVLNVITGVFVDSAVETARTQREFLVQKEMEVKEQWLAEMRNIFFEMDSDSSGTVSKEEVSEFCKDGRVQYYLTALGLDVHDTEWLFELLDEGRDGELELEAFLNGCLRLKGVARSIDVFTLLHQSRQLARRVDDIDKTLHDKMGDGSEWKRNKLCNLKGSRLDKIRANVSTSSPLDAHCEKKASRPEAWP